MKPPKPSAKKCATCSGRGEVLVKHDMMGAEYGKCPDCGGSGKCAEKPEAGEMEDE